HAQRAGRRPVRAEAQGALGSLVDRDPRLLFEAADRLPVRGYVRDARAAEAGARRAAHQLRDCGEARCGAGDLRARIAMARAKGILGQAGPLMLGRGGATVLSFALPL